MATEVKARIEQTLFGISPDNRRSVYRFPVDDFPPGRKVGFPDRWHSAQLLPTRSLSQIPSWTEICWTEVVSAIRVQLRLPAVPRGAERSDPFPLILRSYLPSMYGQGRRCGLD